jgi:hypothetical protein
MRGALLTQAQLGLGYLQRYHPEPAEELFTLALNLYFAQIRMYGLLLPEIHGLSKRMVWQIHTEGSLTLAARTPFAQAP